MRRSKNFGYRILSLILVFTMVVSMSMTAWASEDNTTSETLAEEKTVDETIGDEIIGDETTEDETTMADGNVDDSETGSGTYEQEYSDESAETATDTDETAETDTDYSNNADENAEVDMDSSSNTETAVSETESSVLSAQSDDTDSAEVVAEGSCGTDVTWTLDEDGVLTISGTGDMTDYSNAGAPWYNSYRTKIKQAIIEESVTSIGASAFYGCTKLTKVTIADSVTTIGKYAFWKNYSLTSVTVPDNVTDIGYAAFGDCTSLAEITLGESVQTIGAYAFQAATITSLTLPASVESLGDLICSSCSNLTAFYVDYANTTYSAEDGVLFNKDQTELLCYPQGKADTTYSVPSSVTTVADYAIYNNKYLTSISLTDNITAIGDWAFAYCTALQSLAVPDSVMELGMGIADNCTTLTCASVGSGIDTLSYRTFYGCTALKEVTLSDGLTTIYNWAFYNCQSLTDVNIPSTVISIGVNSFYNCISLTEIVLPEGLETISSYAFNSCTALASINIPSTVTSIEANAFYNCTSLTVEYPSSLTLMDDGSYLLVDTVSISGTYDYEEAYEVLEIVNEERAAEGLSELTMDAELLEAAMQRAAELNVYYSHTRPSGLDCFTVSSKAFGENIAAGYSSATNVMTGWMNSSGHKANILGSSYQSIGIGCFTQNGVKYWVQLFGTGEAAAVSQPDNTSVTTSVMLQPSLYESSFYLYASPAYISIGSERSISVRLTNPGWTSGYAVLDSDSFSYTSSDSSVLTVNESGVFTAVSAGEATITATTASGMLSASKTITVLNLSAPVLTGAEYVNGSVKVTWETVESATKYRIAYTCNGGLPINYKYADAADADIQSCTIPYYYLTEGETYEVYVEAGMDGYYSDASNTLSVYILKDISDCTVTLSDSSYTYDGSAKKPTVTVQDGSTTLTSGTDYTVTYSNNTNAGTATVTVTGKGNYTGSVSTTFTIAKASQTVTASAAASSIYAGKTTTVTGKGTGTITYSSSDTSIAMVSSTGTVTGKNPGTVKITVKAAGNSNYNSATKTVSITVNLASPTVSSVVQSGSNVTVKWGKVTGASGYYVYRSTSSGSGYSKVATITSGSTVSWKDTSSKSNGTTYYYKVYAYNGSTKSAASSYNGIKYMKGTVSSLTNKSAGITVKWSKVSGASGYYIYRRASGASSYTKVKTITSASTVSYTDTAVKSKNGTTYTYYVQPYNSTSKGAYATKKTVRLTGTTISSLKNSASKKMTVKWSKKSGITGYQIQYSTSSSFSSGNKTVTVSGASSTSKVISSLTKKKTYYVRVRTYKTVSGTKYYSAWSSTKKVKISK
ncbi:MAG: leucine-rich repeat protein [Clostridiales bacterium]|nr:leucine-rich repeat protein [Clostridiales bacterium]